ncbi:hypothetical protein EV368DRAFT_65958 [Lentinula lateritia]|uniref:Uncharacterized protein n=1 Tax=Lentinula aff. lateritia TaxID=2804960 RepID=A0ACC1TUZ1_9AGAR|nr:hypothetical protein F5876DRAFT_67147 [Lentinula aff. lateritia]KAJ3851192.1 hypothetical protein EV368DRAFT_65958 [Lentinula lateritia]
MDPIPSTTFIQAYSSDRMLLSKFVASSIVMFLYDWMLMLPAEIEFVWTASLRRPLNASQGFCCIRQSVAEWMVFSLIRTANRCRDVSYFIQHQRMCVFSESLGITLYGGLRGALDAGMYITGIAFTEVVLTARTWALWGKDIRLTIGLPVFFLCCWIPNFYIMHRFLRSQTFSPSPLPQEIGCVILGGQPVLYLCWVLLTIYEAEIVCEFCALVSAVPFDGSSICTVRTGRWLTRVVYKDVSVETVSI